MYVYVHTHAPMHTKCTILNVKSCYMYVYTKFSRAIKSMNFAVKASILEKSMITKK